MTTDLEHRLRALDLSNKQFARMTGIQESTVWGWGRERSSRGVQATPTWALLLVLAWETHPSLIPDDPQNNPQDSTEPRIDRA